MGRSGLRAWKTRAAPFTLKFRAATNHAHPSSKKEFPKVLKN